MERRRVKAIKADISGKVDRARIQVLFNSLEAYNQIGWRSIFFTKRSEMAINDFFLKIFDTNEDKIISFNEILGKIDGVVWGIPTIVLILVTGLVLTIRTRGIQFTKLGCAFKQIFKKNEGEGELSGFSALCTALSATIGTGNIVGVATAIAAGGPGALFWMWFAAILGTATKYAECMLAIKYREVKADGTVLGGPFYTIEKGMGKNWKWLAVLFAIFGTMVGLFGIGTFTQVNGITGAVQNAFDPQKTSIAFSLFGNDYTWATVISGAIITICVALVIIGRLKRIAKKKS